MSKMSGQGFYGEAANAVRSNSFDVQNKVFERAWGTATTELLPSYLDRDLVAHPPACIHYAQEHQGSSDVPILLNAAYERIRSIIQRRRLAVAVAAYGNEESYPLAETLWSPNSDGAVEQIHILDRTSLPEVGLLYQQSPDALERQLREWCVLQYGPFLSPLGIPLLPQENSDQHLPEKSVALPSIGTFKGHIRWLIRRDMPEVLDIERQSFKKAWTEEDFLNALRQRNVIGMVAEYNHRILGFMIYELHRHQLHVSNFAVDPEFRNQGVGSAMFERLVDKLSQQHRQEISFCFGQTIDSIPFFYKRGCDIERVRAMNSGENVGIDLVYKDGSVRSRALHLLSSAIGPIALDHVENTLPDESFETLAQEHCRALAEKTVQQSLPTLELFQRWLRQKNSHVPLAIANAGSKTLHNLREVRSDEWKAIKANATPAPASPPRFLREAVHADLRSTELHELRASGNIEAQDSKERAIMHDVFSEVMKYPHGVKVGKGPAYLVNTPREIVDRRITTCFAGPWVLASMLQQCGIPNERIFYCDDVRFGNRTYFGDHGSLLVRSANNHVMLLDSGHRKLHEQVRVSSAELPDQGAFKKLLMAESLDPAFVHFQKQWQHHDDLPKSMVVMPGNLGFASVHFMNVGLQLSKEGALSEAEEAFTSCISLNPHNTIAKSFLGHVHFRQGRVELSRQRLEAVLAEDSENLFTLFTLGEIALHMGDGDTARKYFQQVCSDKHEIYGDTTLKAKANKYISSTTQGMFDLWKKQQMAA